MSKPLTSDVKKVDSKSQESRHRSEKETRERNSRKKESDPTRSSTLSSQSPPAQEEQSEKATITLTEDEQRIYDFACSELFKAKSPEITKKLKEECGEIAKHVKTLEQFKSLLQFVQALPYIKGQLHLKNLVNGLNGWLQTQPRSGPSKPRAADDPVAKYREIGARFMQEVS